MKTYTRKTIFQSLQSFCSFAGDDDFIEVTEWANGEGFDVWVQSKVGAKFSLTWGEFDLLKKLIKKLDNESNT